MNELGVTKVNPVISPNVTVSNSFELKTTVAKENHEI